MSDDQSFSEDESFSESGRLLESGDEAGTAPDDRRYRPDVEGMRALAIILVVLFHYGVPWLKGGFIGVDVFFVISGFVITGLLLRERQATGTNSLISFYARRCRRILPAATLVIIATVFVTYFLIGIGPGRVAASDGRWAAVFLANVHTSPLSSLGNFWSLAVEEQFYLVFPLLFLFANRSTGRIPPRMRTAVVLGTVIIASYWLSIVQTSSNEGWAYVSPFTCAWELALGSLIALETPMLRRVNVRFGAALTWAGLTVILYSAVAFTSLRNFPGSEVALPVVGAAAIIAGGATAPRFGVEALLGIAPFQWIGKRSYSLYLWHWPVLIVAAMYLGGFHGRWIVRPVLVLGVVALSMGTYRIVENPIRHSRLTSKQSVLLGGALVATTVIVLSLLLALNR
jgi:peptidoglycan/LPS O-acetylase OafA/YrhL